MELKINFTTADLEKKGISIEADLNKKLGVVLEELFLLNNGQAITIVKPMNKDTELILEKLGQDFMSNDSWSLLQKVATLDKEEEVAFMWLLERECKEVGVALEELCTIEVSEMTAVDWAEKKTN